MIKFVQSDIKFYLLIFILIISSLLGKAYAVLPIQEIALSNGSKAYLVQATTIPMIDIEISIDAGSRYDPKEKSGLAGLTAALLTRGIQWQGGILNEAQQADAIADLGASISASASGERTTIRARSLSKPDILNSVLDLLSSTIARPVFDSQIIAREKQRISSAITEGDTKPEVVLQKRFRKELFRNYPLAESPSLQSIAAIGAEDLKIFHRDFYRQDRLIINIVGDLDAKMAKQIAEKLLTQLPWWIMTPDFRRSTARRCRWSTPPRRSLPPWLWARVWPMAPPSPKPRPRTVW
jgi:zinc protease